MYCINRRDRCRFCERGCALLKNIMFYTPCKVSCSVIGGPFHVLQPQPSRRAAVVARGRGDRCAPPASGRARRQRKPRGELDFHFVLRDVTAALFGVFALLTVQYTPLPALPLPAKLIQAHRTHPLRVAAKEPVRRPTHEFQPSRTAQSTDSKATGTGVAAAPTERALPRQTKPPWPMGTAGAWPWIAYSSMERRGASPLPRSSWRASSSGVRPLASLAPARAPGSVYVDTLGLCAQAGPRPRRRRGDGSAEAGRRGPGACAAQLSRR